MISFTAPIPPSLNNAYTNGRGHGRRVLTNEGRDYKERVAKSLLGTQPLPSGARINLSLRLWFRNRRRRDISNCVKLLEDALSEALGFDDCAVDRLLVERVGIDALRPRCEVTIEVLS
jgi:Holliday junction resolvase RusA-like endonuclease